MENSEIETFITIFYISKKEKETYFEEGKGNIFGRRKATWNDTILAIRFNIINVEKLLKVCITYIFSISFYSIYY
jgi:hypothetical protein